MIKYIKHWLSCKEDQRQYASTQYYGAKYIGSITLNLINDTKTWSIILQLSQHRLSCKEYQWWSSSTQYYGGKYNGSITLKIYQLYYNLVKYIKHGSGRTED